MRKAQKQLLLGLVAHGALAPEALFDPETLVEDTSRRNGSFSLRVRQGRALFVKYASRGASYSRIAEEAELVARLGHSAVLQRFVPELVFESASLRAAVYAFVPGRNLLAATFRDADVPLEVGFQLGRQVAVLHTMEAPPMVRERNALLEVAALLIQQGPTQGTQSPSQLRLVRLVQGSKTLLEACARALELSTGELVGIHADLRWDNILIAESENGADVPGRYELRVVDWEFAAWGPQVWDLGCLAASAFFTWLGAIEVEDPGDANPCRLALGYTDDMASSFARSVLAGYGWQGCEREWGALSDCIVLRLVQLAYGTEGKRCALRSSSVLALQFAENMAAGRGAVLRTLVDGARA